MGATKNLLVKNLKNTAAKTLTAKLVKAGKAPKAVKPAKAQTTPQAAATPVEAPKPQEAPKTAPQTASPLAGYNACGLLRAMGYAGFTAKQGMLACAALGWATSPHTVSCQLGAGRQYATGTPKPHHTGPISPLAGAALEVVVAAVGQPAKPHATTAPLPAVQPKAATLAQLVKGNPQVAAAQAALQAALAAAQGK